MKIYQDKFLRDYTTFKMGGLVKNIYYPETIEDLEQLEKLDHEVFQHILGGGSNILVNDGKIFSGVICTKKLNNMVEKKGDNKYYIGSGITLQKTIQIINNAGYGGIEYLYSVPGSIGGAICMNAGRGREYKKSISDYIISVDYFQAGKVYTIPAKQCEFEFRKSIFQQLEGCIIIGALFEFPRVNQKESEYRIQERLDFCKKTQDISKPNMGSVFSEYDKYIMDYVTKSQENTGIMYSNKTINWLLNNGGTFNEALSMIDRVKELHEKKGKKCSVEVKIWY